MRQQTSQDSSTPKNCALPIKIAERMASAMSVLARFARVILVRCMNTTSMIQKIIGYRFVTDEMSLRLSRDESSVEKIAKRN